MKPVYTFTLRPDGKGLLCDPPGPCRCGRAAAIFVVRGGETGCVDCLPETRPEATKAAQP